MLLVNRYWNRVHYCQSRGACAGLDPVVEIQRLRRLVAKLDARLRGCSVIVKTPHIRIFVIPGLTRNPALFQRFTLLDAGSSPA